jgi:SAM-dependent methyltransferase
LREIGLAAKMSGMQNSTTELDPVGVFFADPESHLSDILYLYFRAYKRKLIWSFFNQALTQLNLPPSATVSIADIGASSGFDALYLLRRLTGNFRDPIPYEKISLELVEGDARLIQEGGNIFRSALPKSGVQFHYHDVPLVEGIPLEANSQDIVICSEVVEHLEHPELLLGDIFRILKPGGFLMLTTDNSPSVLQLIRRIPIWLKGRYNEVYKRPEKESEIFTTTCHQGQYYPIYGHINLNRTSYWEKLCVNAGFEINSYGTYESIRRGGGSKSPMALAAYFLAGALVYHLLPPNLGRHFGDTTALLLKRSVAKASFESAILF